jgi:hypothetical protein
LGYQHVSFPLQTPGDRAGQVLAELENALGTHVAIGSDAIVTIPVEADTRDAANEAVVEAIHSLHADGYFDLSGLRHPMGISVRRYRMGAGSHEELTRLVTEGFARILSEAEGFVAYHLIDAGNREVVSIRIFSDRRTLDASEELTADWVRQNLGRFRLRRVEELEGDVLVSRRAR